MKIKYFFNIFILIFTCLVLANTVLAAPCVPGQTGTELCNPLQRPGSDGTPGGVDFRSTVMKFLFIFAGFSTLIPIIAVTFSGFAMIVSQGNTEAVTRARTALTWSVYGFIMAVLSYVFVAGMIRFLGADNIGLLSPDTPPPSLVNPLSESDFLRFVYGMLRRFLEIAGIIAVLMLILNGLRYITASGDEEQIKQAKSAMQWIVAGLITILLSYVIIRATANLVGLP